MLSIFVKVKIKQIINLIKRETFLLCKQLIIPIKIQYKITNIQIMNLYTDKYK